MNKIIYGIHTVQAMLNRSPESFQSVFILNKRKNRRLTSLVRSLKSHGITIQLENRQCMDKKSDGAIHQGIIALIRLERQFLENDLPGLIATLNNPFFLILDSVSDPHNLGACLRSADAAGVHAVIISKNRSVHLNAVAKKVACGAAENIPVICVTNLVRTIRFLQKKNIWIIGTDIKANYTIYQRTIKDRLALVMGAEEKGMRRIVREHCDELISIPMMGSVPSLNVSVATGIFLFEIVRNRIK